MIGRLRALLVLAAMPVCGGADCANLGTGFPRRAAWTQTAVSTNAGVSPSAIVAGDFDGDSRVDIAVAYQGLDTSPPRIVILFRQADNTFTPVTLIEGDNVAGAVKLAVGDVNGDDRLDLVAACTDRVVYLPGPANPRQAANWNAFEIANSTGNTVGPWNDVAIANIDDANGPDIVACGQEPGRLCWFSSPAANIANGVGWQRIDIDATTRAGAASLAVADINGDGKIDIYSTAPQETSARVAWYQNPSNPVSQAWTKFTIGNVAAATRLAIGDLNADGRPDVVVTNPTGRQVGWYVRPQNPADAWSGFLITQYAAATPADIAIADIDGNGQLDIVVSSRNPGSLRWFTPVGTVTNQWIENNLIDLPTGVNAGRILLLDFDGDARPDVFGCLIGQSANQDALARWENPE
ncbi:MAG: VCBS repeat-containing protein [Phycisphaerae bacterium]|nr:VCBS repeat-containing protein [Phycisphaerae bacterium]